MMNPMPNDEHQDIFMGLPGIPLVGRVWVSYVPESTSPIVTKVGPKTIACQTSLCFLTKPRPSIAARIGGGQPICSLKS